MSAKQGFLGLSPAGGIAALGAVAAVIAGVFYATGTLGPRGVAPAPQDAALPQAVAPATPAPQLVAEAPVATPVTTPVAEAQTEAPATETTAAAPTEEAPRETPVEQAAVPAPTGAPVAETQTEAPVADTTAAPTDETQAEAPVVDTAAAPTDETQAETPAAQPAAEASVEEKTAEAVPAAAPKETAALSRPEPAAADPLPQVDAAPLPAPRFDVVRAAPDGMTVVAGQSAPGSTVTVLLDGSDLDTVTADAGGEFVAILSLTPSTLARVLTLRATQDDRTALSVEDIILAPAPVTVAEAAPHPKDSPAQTVTAEAAAEEPAQSTVETPVAEAPKTEATTAEAATAEAIAAPAADAAPESETTPAAPAAIAVLRADAQGVELLQPATPAPDAPPAQIMLDTIGYGADGAVLLSGRAAASAAIRVYLDNRSVADLAAAEDGRWRAALADVTPGIYTLRLDALDADGAVSSRLETPFQREAPEALAAAEAAAAAVPPALPVRQLTVQAGDTLWAISRERYGDGMLFVRVFEANRDAIRDPDLIYPGQVFTLPD